MAPIETGWLVIDEFAARFVYFFAGYWLARHVFAFAQEVERPQSARHTGRPRHLGRHQCDIGGQWRWRICRASASSWASSAPAPSSPRACFLARFKFARHPLLRRELHRHLSLLLHVHGGDPHRAAQDGVIDDLAIVSLIVTAAGVVGPVLLFWAVRKTPLSFLFRRPQWAQLSALRERRQKRGSQNLSAARRKAGSLSAQDGI